MAPLQSGWDDVLEFSRPYFRLAARLHRLVILLIPTRFVCYSFAIACGALFVTAYFPLRVALGLDTPDSLLMGDVAMNVVGQRYFVGDAWHWPIFVTTLLEPPQGVNIALTDSIPLAALAAKLLSPLLPHPVTFVHAWLALCYILQPAAAVFALRGTGERRLLPAAAAAIMAICLPTLLFRAGHIALCSHFLLLTALGLYLRIQNDARPRPVATTSLLTATLLIHPYLLVMVAALLAAAPLSLLLRRNAAWRPVAISLLPGFVLPILLAWLLGYGGESPGGGFGLASMNLLSPVYPAFSFLMQDVLPGLDKPLDATGFQYEGYQYLGAGLLLLLATTSMLTLRSQWADLLRRHAGLVLICLALTLFALSSSIYLGQKLLVSTGNVPAILHHLRASGRFFWPVAYVLLIGSIAVLLRSVSYRAALCILAAATFLQFEDTKLLRRSVAGHTSLAVPEFVDRARLGTLVAGRDRLTIWPTTACGTMVSLTPEFMAVIVAASDRLVPVNTMYTAREQPHPDCDAMRVASAPLAPHELRVFMPSAASAATASVPDGARFCRGLGRLAVCTRNEAVLHGLREPVMPNVVLGTPIDAASPQAHPYLALGWAGQEPVGIWSLGPVSILAFHLPAAPTGPVTVTLSGSGLAAPRPGGTQHIRISASGTQVAAWDVAQSGFAEYRATVPPDLVHDGNLVLRLDIAHPVRPLDLKINADTRQLGFFLKSLRIDRNPPGPPLSRLGTN